ncbi:HPr family phosphocarrier protein [Entomospira culicis]|uniref:HPr family phosphocarrier protein n=1 Tax=Entomospira culicis TaxID=2719989 RepID=A0A968GGV0_9SPIO|nr:HPr family phosphocarrier protein [Entomospira culicis]NIZ19863.1 HPr family phosphocarrier protein [Entomospira culicis]NIZ70077.1 HPr family phosphocarrier protein [Entomospira culicis]WDI37181.1 HPr family phosphocarrier protein [Entomospira culicis]WDI38810.1 HPr family phosphocarrier protein [Entomospira culicis]
MVSQKVTIIDPIGLHARPASILVKEAKKYQSAMTMRYGEKEASLSAMLKILSLAVSEGAEVEIIAEGSDETDALAGMIEAMKSNNLI